MLNFGLKGIRLINVKRRVFVLSAATFCIISILLISCFPNRRGLELLFFFAYMTVACTFIPLPTPQLVIYYGEKFNPFLVALVGGIGTCIACLIDYTLLFYAFEYASKSEKIAKLKATRFYRYVYQYIVRLFNKAAFISMVIAGMTPIPFEPIKFLAIATRYNRFKYVLSVFVGRTPRYFMLATIGHNLMNIEHNFYVNIFLFGTLFLMLIFLLLKRISKVIKNRRNERKLCHDKSNITKV